MTEEEHDLFNHEFDILDNHFDFDEDYSDDEAIYLVDQLNQKAGISNTILPEISDHIFTVLSSNASKVNSNPTETKKRDREEEEKDINLEGLIDEVIAEISTTSTIPSSPNSDLNTSNVTRSSNVNSTEQHGAVRNSPPQATKTETGTVVKKKKSSSKKKKSKLPAPKPPPPPISKYDPRRTFARMMLNTFNSCDTKKLIDIFNAYVIEDVVVVHRYDGEKNPYGRDLTCVNGRAANVQLWTQLFKSAPDFFYDVLDANAYYSPDWKVMVASRFQWCGTRIADIRVARTTNERVLQRKLFESSKYVTDEKELLEQLVSEKEEVLNDLSQPAQAEKKTDSSLFAHDESYFNAETNRLIANEEDKFYLDSNPLPQRQHMECVGTLFLELNDERKIVKMEFVFTALSEKKLQLEAATAATVSSNEESTIDGNITSVGSEGR
mmetsp:Transcript_12482/g.13456  ORF Transcript_12482/g.13456 Transcript_12482/m.13456 type:complete len:438 (+) Transcript_12482:179-1492(+)